MEIVLQGAFLEAIRDATKEKRQIQIDIMQRGNAVQMDSAMEESQRINNKNNRAQATNV